MTMTMWKLRPLCLVPLLAFVASTANAQIGGGWQQVRPGSNIHLDGSDGIETSPGNITNRRNEGASFRKSGSVETFTVFDPISNRSERRLRNDYTSGRWQFQGEVRVSPPTDGQSVMQIFGGRTPATTQMIRAYRSGGGTLRKIPGSVTLASGIHGKWLRINVIHDVGANTVRTYVNGQLKATGDGEAPSKWYHKYGCYGTLRTGSAKVEWRNVKHFRHSSNDDNDQFALEEDRADADTAPVQEPADDLAADPQLDDVAGEPAFGCALASPAATPPRWTLALVMALLLGRRLWRRRR
jgi:hypothetical protein